MEDSIYLTHTLSVDDVLIFGDGNASEWLHIKALVDIFCGASGMSISACKSVFSHFGIEQGIIDATALIYPYKWKNLDEGFTYLGFHLKPNNYLREDWSWLLKKFQGRMNRWSPRWLSLEGRDTLVTSILQSIPIYWFSLFYLLTGVLSALCRLMSCFLWTCTYDNNKFHLSGWKSLSKPKAWGGWGLSILVVSIFLSVPRVCGEDL